MLHRLASGLIQYNEKKLRASGVQRESNCCSLLAQTPPLFSNPMLVIIVSNSGWGTRTECGEETARPILNECLHITCIALANHQDHQPQIIEGETTAAGLALLLPPQALAHQSKILLRIWMRICTRGSLHSRFLLLQVCSGKPLNQGYSDLLHATASGLAPTGPRPEEAISCSSRIVASRSGPKEKARRDV